MGLILSDINMPNMDGLQFLSHVRAKPEWAQIPIVMITQKSCLPLGPDGNNRYQISQNFRIRAIRPTAGRTA